MTRAALSRQTAIHRGEGGAEWARAVALIWAGMVLGVAFIATPAKFRAKSLPRPMALDIGRETFRAFGRVELIPAVLLGLSAAGAARARLLAAAPGAIVLTQALWLRPRLAGRTEQIVQGEVPPAPSGLHLAYVASEIAKLCALLGLGLERLRPNRNQPQRS